MLRKLIQTEETLANAADKAGIDEKTARKYRGSAAIPSQMAALHTVPDPQGPQGPDPQGPAPQPTRPPARPVPAAAPSGAGTCAGRPPPTDWPRSLTPSRPASLSRVLHGNSSLASHSTVRAPRGCVAHTSPTCKRVDDLVGPDIHSLARRIHPSSLIPSLVGPGIHSLARRAHIGGIAPACAIQPFDALTAGHRGKPEELGRVRVPW